MRGYSYGVWAGLWLAVLCQLPPSRARALDADPLQPSAAAAEARVVDVVVTGSRAPEESNQALVFTGVVGRKAIRESGARDASEALEHSPSLQLTR